MTATQRLSWVFWETQPNIFDTFDLKKKTQTTMKMTIFHGHKVRNSHMLKCNENLLEEGIRIWPRLNRLNTSQLDTPSWSNMRHS